VTVVCPVGFWALRKVIERHVITPEDAETVRGGDFAIRAEVTPERPALDALTSAVVAWSDRIDLGVPGQSRAVVDALTDLTGGPPAQVAAWRDWVGAIAAQDPPLLVLLSHTVTEQGTAALEIGPDGAGSRALRIGLIREFVKRDPDGRPLVLLLGCDTGVERAEPETFIARLRDVGAAIVVGTVSPVLGENAATVAVALLGELQTTVEDPALEEEGHVATFGDTMVRVRRTLVAGGHLTALCLTSVGDADWQLAPAASRG
jgi:hypothetical protein